MANQRNQNIEPNPKSVLLNHAFDQARLAGANSANREHQMVVEGVEKQTQNIIYPSEPASKLLSNPFKLKQLCKKMEFRNDLKQKQSITIDPHTKVMLSNHLEISLKRKSDLVVVCNHGIGNYLRDR